MVTAAELLASAAFYDGKEAQAFPSFGSERTGAPVMAFCRIGTSPIRSREPVSQPDVLLIQDPTLLHHVDVFSGLSARGLIFMNSIQTIEALDLQDWVRQHPHIQVICIPASDLAEKYVGRSIANIGMVAGFAAVTGVISKAAVQRVITEKFPGKLGELNWKVASEVFDFFEPRTLHV